MQNRLARITAQAPFSCSILFVGEDREGAVRTDLAQPGFHLLRASDAREARKIFAERPDISVIVLDLDSAGAEAGHLAGKLRTAHPERDWVEYVILSRNTAPEFSQPAGTEAPELLVKPLGPGQLLAAVTESYNSSRLRRLNEEERHALEAPIAEFQMRVGAAASQLLARIRQGGAAPLGAPPTVEDREAARHLRALIGEEQMRARQREKVFGELAHNRASWMLLLALAEAFQAGQEITIKATAYHAGLPLSSALRRLNEMCAEGLVVRRGDPRDARRSFVSLTPLGQSYFARYEAEVSRAKKADKTS